MWLTYPTLFPMFLYGSLVLAKSLCAFVNGSPDVNVLSFCPQTKCGFRLSTYSNWYDQMVSRLIGLPSRFIIANYNSLPFSTTQFVLIGTCSLSKCKICLIVPLTIRTAFIYITNREGLYQNKVNSSPVSTC